MGQETAIGREPFFYVEIDLDICSRVYADGFCQAAAKHTGIAQSATGLQIKLAADASAVDDFYNGSEVIITSGPISGEQNTITDYNGTTKWALVDTVWSSSVDVIGESYTVLGDPPFPDACYNTFLTCQDRANYLISTQTFKLSTNKIRPPLGVSMFPCIVGNPNITPARLEIENGIGQRGAVSITVQDFPHNDAGIDSYLSTRFGSPAGTFFNKLRRRNPFYQNRNFRLVTGYILDGAIVDTTTRAYLIDSFDGPDKKGQFKINAKDVLKLADDKASTCPKEYDIALGAALTIGATSIALRTGDGAKLPASTGTVRIDDEIISYTGLTTDTLTGCTRATWGTTAATHDIDKKVDVCKTFSGVNVVNVIEDILLNYAGIDAAFIPFDDGAPGDEWDDEKSNWLNSNTLTKVISRPTKVNDLLKRLCIQNSLSLWYNELEQKIKMSASSIALGNQVPGSIDDIANIINNSLKVVEDTDSRLSQIWIFYDPKDSSESLDEPNNYKGVGVFINEDYEADGAYGEPRIERIYADWLTAANAGIVSTMASRLLLKDLTQTFKIDFALDAKDAELWTGQHVLLSHPDIVGADGLPEVQKIQITQAKETEPGHRFDYKARANVFNQEQRFFFIASNSVGDYSTATDTEKAENGFISDGGSQFPDGGAPYSIV